MPYLSSTQLPGTLVFLLLPGKSPFGAKIGHPDALVQILLALGMELHKTEKVSVYRASTPTFSLKTHGTSPRCFLEP